MSNAAPDTGRALSGIGGAHRMSLLIAAFLASLANTSVAAQSNALPLETIKLPPGFSIELLARVENARGMALGARGTLFVGSMQAGKVYAVRMRPDALPEVTTIASGLRLPVGVAFRDGALYVSAVDRILRFDDIEGKLAQPPAPRVVSDRFPGDTHHGWKFIAFGPDGKLYVPVGAPCNICEPDSNRYAIIMRMNADGSGAEVYARGIRNSVGFDWDPKTHDLWFTENGRAIAYEPFASGWLQGEKVWGRPADVLVMPDGSLLVSDDYAGAIYRISYAIKR